VRFDINLLIGPSQNMKIDMEKAAHNVYKNFICALQGSPWKSKKFTDILEIN